MISLQHRQRRLRTHRSGLLGWAALPWLVGGMFTCACLDDALGEDNLGADAVEPSADSPIEGTPEADDDSGTLSLRLRSGEFLIDFVTLRVTLPGQSVPVFDQALDVRGTPDSVDVTVVLTPGQYIVELRAITANGHPCVGSDSLEVLAGEPAQLALQVECAAEPLEVGLAQVNVLDEAGQIVRTQTVSVDQLGSMALFSDLPDGHYVVWITATTADGKPCLGSQAFEVAPGGDADIRLQVVCQD